ncbi:MAG: RsmB/NOP family class I SAM-dependent RNA methyltransferase [Rhodobacteraceae bacterium]|nr:RsmB/NOP family class I SAM-dependent RNA methyltransferase [Paracoccaceae bacterium]
MTPAARVAAAAEILDRISSGEPAEKVLTTWARQNRYAGSGDRAAIRDHVYDCLRCLRSYAALGGGDSGRALVIGALRAAGKDPEEYLTGDRHALSPMTEAEKAPPPELSSQPRGVRLDCPDWLLPYFDASLAQPDEALNGLRQRAPVFLRVNLRKTDAENAIKALSAEGISAHRHPLAETALEVTEGARRIQSSDAYRQGLVELQDAASQAVVESLPLKPGMKILDHCAGGGGKTLAMAGQVSGTFHAHDADPRRMRDLPERANRAGVEVALLETQDVLTKGPFDLVLCDVPCSGSGSWRRSPEAKWRLTPERLDELTKIQAQILRDASGLVAEGGVLAYATCSLLSVENGEQVDRFVGDHSGWSISSSRQLDLRDGGDGFFIAILKRD